MVSAPLTLASARLFTSRSPCSSSNSLAYPAWATCSRRTSATQLSKTTLHRIRVFQQAPCEGLAGVEKDIGAGVGGWVIVSGLVESREVGGVDTPCSFCHRGVGRGARRVGGIGVDSTLRDGPDPCRHGSQARGTGVQVVGTGDNNGIAYRMQVSGDGEQSHAASASIERRETVSVVL